MTTTNFVSGTVIDAAWLNDVDEAVYNGLPATQSFYTPAGTGAVATTVQAKLRESVSVLDFGALCDWDGVTGTDDSAAVQLAITHCITNDVDLVVPALCKLGSSVNIDRQVDGAAFDNYFTIKGGGGFVVTTAMSMFSSSIAFTTAPVSQLVYFDGLTFIGNSGASYVLDDGRFLRTRFNACNFDKILCCNSSIYTQSLQFTNCNIRRNTGNFFTSVGESYDFKFIGNIVEAFTGDLLRLGKVLGGAVIGNLLEGISGTAIIYNGAAGLAISGNYFESNGLDIDGTGATQASGVHITGNYFSHTVGASDPLVYSVVWGNGSPVNCVSIGNHHNARMHNFPVAGMDVLVKDSASDMVFNNEPRPFFNTSIAFNDNGVLGNTYGGVVTGYGVGGQGGYAGFGVLNAGTYTEAITADETGKVQANNALIVKGATPAGAAGQLGLGITTATTATAGVQTLPANPATFLQISVGGVFYKIPLYNT